MHPSAASFCVSARPAYLGPPKACDLYIVRVSQGDTEWLPVSLQSYTHGSYCLEIISQFLTNRGMVHEYILEISFQVVVGCCGQVSLAFSHQPTQKKMFGKYGPICSYETRRISQHAWNPIEVSIWRCMWCLKTSPWWFTSLPEAKCIEVLLVISRGCTELCSPLLSCLFIFFLFHYCHYYIFFVYLYV